MNRLSGRVLLIVAAFALFLVPVAAIAAAGFTDVEDDSVFKADIAWLADADVTRGCNPPANDKFCPEDNVTREQMAAFMHRLAVNRVVDADKVDGKDASAFATSGHNHDAAYLAANGKAVDADKVDGFSVESIVPRAVGTTYSRLAAQPDEFVATVTIDAPARGVIIAHAGGDMWMGTGAQLCYLYVDETDYMGGGGFVDHSQHFEADCITSASLVVDAGVHTVDLFLSGDAAVVDGAAMWAMWVPFDGTGAVPAGAAVLGSVEVGEK